jgi:glycosyltransferase involved in cell wall biosynthesis
MSQENVVCLVVIARNEQRSILRCLNSFANHVDRMLVLDTGSSDDTVALSKAAGAQVSAFEWIDDFSAARNAALELAAADWHLVADADEWLLSGSEFLPELRSCPRNRMGTVLIRNQYDSRGQNGALAAWVPRFLPGNVRYRGRIHEQPDAEMPMVQIPLTFGHDGYCEAQRRSKEGRNEKLLRAALTTSPENPYLLYQLGCELRARMSFAEAVATYQLALRLTPLNSDYRVDLVRRLLSALQIEREWMASVNLLDQEMQRYSNSKTFMLTVGDTFWNWAQDEPNKAVNLLPMAEDAWMQALHLDRLSDSAHGHQLEQVGARAALSLSVLCRQFGQDARAVQFEAYATQLRATDAVSFQATESVIRG